MIHEINPHKLNNQYLIFTSIKETDFVLCYKDNSFLVKTCEDKLEIPCKKDIPEITEKTKGTFLFSFNDIPCFLIKEDIKTENPNLIFKEINLFRSTDQPEIAWIGMVGHQLKNWYVQNKFCGKCGAKTQHKNDERALICTNCDTTLYPKISPAIIVAIICKNKILLARGSNFSGSWYSLVAGYVDVGETLEETVQREVKEEVGLDVNNIRYYKSQPWPLSASMMIGFVAEADENQTIVIDKNEIGEAIWFERGSLPQYSLNLSIAGEMIEKFEKGEL